jgi:hypothetical protein
VRFASELKDALYVNWALPIASLPAAPEPLELETLRRGDLELGFVTLLLFRQTGLRRVDLPWPALSFPQCNFRLLVRDEERVASVLFLRQLVPAWVVPFARVFGRQPASAAVFQSTGENDVEVRWRFAAGQRLDLVAKPGAARTEPLVPGGWIENVAYFRERPRGYIATNRGLRQIQAAHPASEAIPMRIELGCSDWLEARLPDVPPEAWAQVHSAFLIPSIQLSVAVATDRASEAAETIPASGRAAIS